MAMSRARNASQSSGGDVERGDEGSSGHMVIGDLDLGELGVVYTAGRCYIKVVFTSTSFFAELGSSCCSPSSIPLH